jgi:Protein of unknown function (DUF1326)
MDMKLKLSLTVLSLAASVAFASKPAVPSISGDYLEVRSCDVYTGPCFANGEMGLAGKEGMLVWSVRQGAWHGVKLDGLKVIAIVHTDNTLGDLHYQPRCGEAVLVVDQSATSKQRAALVDFARTMAGGLIKDVAAVKVAPVDAIIGMNGMKGCASVKAGNLVQISTRCLGEKDCICGNEETFYPPLTEVSDASPAFTELASYEGSGLNLTWDLVGKRSAFVGQFAR